MNSIEVLKKDLNERVADLEGLHGKREAIEKAVEMATAQMKTYQEEFEELDEQLPYEIIAAAESGGGYEGAQETKARMSELKQLIASAEQGVPSLQTKIYEIKRQCRVVVKI